MLQRYQALDVTTASPETLIVRLYEGAIRNALQARAHLKAGCGTERARSLSKAVAIVSELQRVLDREKGGEISRNLHELYDFVVTRWVTANVENQIQPIDDGVGVLSTLLEAWRQIARGGDPRGEAR